MQRSNAWLALVGFGATVFGAGALAAKYSPRDLRTRIWYKRLDKPPYNPPQAVFPIVWTALYALVAFSGWRVWQQEDSAARSRALRLWLSQLATNAEWTRLFFGRHSPKLALADVVALEAMILGYIMEAAKVDGVASACFIPYAAWVGFATVLNADIARRNPNAEDLFPGPRIA